MSMFSTDIRVANTAAPSFQSQANVSQYGWTGADQGHYNQLIQYVDECRKIYLSLEEKILYVEEILKEVEDIDAQVKYVEQMTKAVIEAKDQTFEYATEVQDMYNEVKPMYENFVLSYTEFNTKYTDFLAKYPEVLEAATNAKVSETNAAQSAQDAADIAEELRKGQVYRGTWNIEANNSYPPRPDTNSVWDVVLNESSVEWLFDGQTWYWGDRILYLKDDNAFTQIESGSTVTSVNHKTGAVTLTYQDVHAAPEGFGLGDAKMTALGTASCNDAVGTGWYGINSATTETPIGTGPSGSVLQTMKWGGGVVMQVFYNLTSDRTYTRRLNSGTWSAWVELYSTFNKPSPNAIGAVNKAGDAMTGHLILTDANTTIRNSGNTNMLRASNQSTVVGNSEGRTYVDSKDNPVVRIGSPNTEHKIYHEGFKPTAGVVGALPITGGKLTGTLSIAPAVGQNGVSIFQSPNTSTNAIGVSGLTSDGSQVVWGSGVLYSGGNPQYAYYGWGSSPWETGLKINSNGTYVTGLLGTENGSIVANNGRFLCNTNTILPMFEMHIPGKVANAIYTETNGNMVFSRSNGSGSNVGTYLQLNTNIADFANRLQCRTTNRSWGAMGQSGVYVVPTNNAGNDILESCVSLRSFWPGVYESEAMFGVYHGADWNNTALILNNWNNTLGKQFTWYFRNNSALQKPNGTVMTAWGDVDSPLFKGTMTSWMMDNFSAGGLNINARDTHQSEKSALSDISKMKFYSNARSGVGFSAEDLEELDEGYVKTVKTYGEEATSVKALDTANLLALALKAIQELQAEVQDLKTQLNK